MIFLKKSSCKLCGFLIFDYVHNVDPIRNERYIICPCCYQVTNAMGKKWENKVDDYIKERTRGVYKYADNKKV